jgi:effector-binding domain-containing protein
MKLLKLIGVIVSGLLFLIVLISFFLPEYYHIQRSINIQSDVSVPFKLVKDFKSWDLWSPWHEIDTTMEKTYSELVGVEGAWYSWDSKNPDAGKGKVTITKIIENEFIENELYFHGMGTSIATYTFEKEATGVKVTWTLEGSGKGMPWYMKISSKYFYLMMDKLVGKDYEKGLTKLKQVAENSPQTDKVAGFEIELRTIDKFIVSGIRQKVKTSELSSLVFGKWFGQISQLISQQNIQPTGFPLSIYHQYGPNIVDVEAAIPTVSIGKNEGLVLFREIPSTDAFVVKYYGDYTKVENVYMAAFEYIKQKGMTSTGAPMEIYVTDPGMEKDTAKWLTEIVFPLDK